MLLGPPGKDEIDQISLNDENFSELFDTLVEIASVVVIERYYAQNPLEAAKDDSFNPVLRRRAVEAMRLSDFEEHEGRNGFINILFGPDTILSREQFI